MSNPFAKGNETLLSKASINGISSVDDFAPSYTEQIGAEFDKFYYGMGIGIKKTQNDSIKREVSKLEGLSFDDRLNAEKYYTMKHNGIGQEQINDHFTEEGAQYYSDLLDSFEDLKKPEELKSETKARILGEVETAESISARGEDFTAKLIGGAGGAFTNPAVLASVMVPFGGGVNVAANGSKIANILKVSTAEGLIGAGVELTTIQFQKQNAAYLNKDLSNWDIAQNAAMAGLGGFLLTGLGKSGLDTYTYVKELRRGVNDAQEIVLKNVDVPEGSDSAIKQMDDFVYTAERAIDGHEPIHGKDITPEQYQAHMDKSGEALKEASDWGDFKKPIDEIEPPAVKADIAPRVGDEKIYSDLLTEADRAYDADLYARAAKIDSEIPLDVKIDKEGAVVIETRNAKNITKELDDQISSLEGVAMCMRGAQ
jgi:hypothetical protein